MLAAMKPMKWSFLPLLLVCLTGGFASAQDRRPDCYVLSVGVDRYQKANVLHGCVNDARNASQMFRQQEGLLFNKVHCTELVDAQASRQQIDKEMQALAKVGKAGDLIVLFLSGHGDRRNKTWAFLAQDFDAQRYADTTVSDAAILRLADALAAEGKKVCVIVDACFAGQLRLNARSLLARYRDPAKGGIIVMVSSMPNQTSAACGAYSAFAYAVKEGMDGKADFNGDGQVTLQELRRYAYHRVYELQNGDQDGEIDYSLSLSDAMVMAKKLNAAPAVAPPVQPNQPPPKANAVQDKLTAKDPFDRVRKGCHVKVFAVRLAAGRHVIDLTSGDGRAGPHNPGFFDTFLRIEDAQGNVVAENDDHGGTFNSQVTLQIAQPGEYRVVVTSYGQGATGTFELRIR
jgi:hypothetical protein